MCTFDAKMQNVNPIYLYMYNSHESGDQTRNHDLEIFFPVHLRGPDFLVYYSI